MAHKLPSYYLPIKTKREPIRDEEKWNDAEKFFEDKEYKKAVISTLEYLNQDIFKGINLKKDISINRVHGNIAIKIELDDRYFKLYTEIVAIDSNTQLIPLLRKVAEVNFSLLDFSHIVYDDDKIYIDYQLELHRCKPNIINWVFQEIIFNADELCNEFIYKYGATDINAIAKNRLNQSQKTKTIKQIRLYLDEFSKYEKELEKDGKSDFVWDMVIITLYKLANMSYINGYLKFELMQKLSMIHDRDIDFYERIKQGKTFINELQEKNDKFYEDILYFREDLVSMLKFSNTDILKSWFEDYGENLVKMENSNDYFSMSYYMEAMFLRVIYNYNLSPIQKNAIEDTLKDVSNAEVEYAQKKLVKLYNKFINKELSDKSSKFGFLKSIFFWLIWLFAINVIFRMFN